MVVVANVIATLIRRHFNGLRGPPVVGTPNATHEGIGKTFPNSYILVRRLLDGKPTILQMTETDLHGTRYHHVLLHDGGVIFIDKGNFKQYCDNWAILVLADQKPQGILCNMQFHEWFILVTSSPREDNYKHLVKHYSAPLFYMAPWNWNEIAAAAMYVFQTTPARVLYADLSEGVSISCRKPGLQSYTICTQNMDPFPVSSWKHSLQIRAMTYTMRPSKVMIELCESR
jgi:hypothetical protein